MSQFLARLNASQSQKDNKASSIELDEVAERLPEGSNAIPGCILNPDMSWNWNAIAAMIYVRAKREDETFTIEKAKASVGLYNIRDFAYELVYFYGDTLEQELVKERWQRIYDVIDGKLPVCDSCGMHLDPEWQYCPRCNNSLKQEKTPTVANTEVVNPTQ